MNLLQQAETKADRQAIGTVGIAPLLLVHSKDVTETQHVR